MGNGWSFESLGVDSNVCHSGCARLIDGENARAQRRKDAKTQRRKDAKTQRRKDAKGDDGSEMLIDRLNPIVLRERRSSDFTSPPLRPGVFAFLLGRTVAESVRIEECVVAEGAEEPAGLTS